MKLSSPYLNILIVAGIILFYIDVILFGIDEGTPASRCSVNALCMVCEKIGGGGEGERWRECLPRMDMSLFLLASALVTCV